MRTGCTKIEQPTHELPCAHSLSMQGPMLRTNAWNQLTHAGPPVSRTNGTRCLAPLTSVGQPGSSAGNQPCEGVATLPSSKRGTTNQDRPGRVISEVIEPEEASIIPGWGHPNELKHPSKRAHCLVPRHGHTLRFDNPHQTHRLSHPKLAVPLLCSGSSVPACAKIDPD